MDVSAASAHASLTIKAPQCRFPPGVAPTQGMETENAPNSPNRPPRSPNYCTLPGSSKPLYPKLPPWPLDGRTLPLALRNTSLGKFHFVIDYIFFMVVPSRSISRPPPEVPAQSPEGFGGRQMAENRNGSPQLDR